MDSEEQIKELQEALEYERNKRQHLLEVETDLARYEAVKALCETHRELQTAENILGKLPDEIAETKMLVMRRLDSLGVELIGVVGEIVPRLLYEHEAYRSKKGDPVEIVVPGYKVRSTGHVIFPAITFPVD